MSDSLAGFVSAGMDTARVRGDEADKKRRRDSARLARRGLAALVVDAHGGIEALKADRKKLDEAVEEFVGLLELLGLNVPPEHKPGCCRNCRRVLPMLAASTTGNPGRPHWRAGYCSAACWAEARDGR